MFLQNMILVEKCIKHLILGIFFSFSYKLSGNLMAENHALRRKLLVFTLRFPESINIFYRSDLRDQFFVFRRQILAYKCDVTTSCTSVGIGDQTIHGCTGPTNQWERSVGMTHEALINFNFFFEKK